MTTERKVLAWTGLVGSLIVCCPCALLGGLFTFGGIIGAVEPDEFSDSSPAAMAVFSVFAGVVTLVVLALGVFFFVWGARTLLAGSRATGDGSSPTQEF